MKIRSLIFMGMACVVLMATGCSVFAVEAVSPAEGAAVQALFDDVADRFPNVNDSSDLVSGGPCPFGEPYGKLLIERDQVLCFIESELVVHGISPTPISVILAEDFEQGGFETMVDETGQVEWLEGDLDGEPFVFVERFVSGFSVIAARPITEGASSEALATSLFEELDSSAAGRVRTLATVDLGQILAAAEEIHDF